MSDDRWLKELLEVNRELEAEERSRLDERWDRLAAGTLTAAEEAELRALADSSDEARQAYEAFRPLGPDFQARVVAAARSELAGSAPRAAPPEPRARLLPFRRAVSRAQVWMGAAAAIAAALFLVLRAGAPLPPLPAYKIQLNPGIQAYRGGEPKPASGVPVFGPGSQLSLTVQPATAIKGGVDARGFLSSSTGNEDLRAWEPAPPFETSERGAVHLRGRLGQDIQLPPGALTIWVAVARKGKTPSASELQARLRAGRPQQEDWQAVCADVTAEPTPREPWQVACADLRVESALSP